MSLDPEEALATVTEMGRRTRMYGGAFSILWHNSTLETGEVKRLYLRLISELAR